MELVEVLTRFGEDLPPGAISGLESLVEELMRWNRRRNLTAITDSVEVLEKHLLDSLTILPYARQASRMLDIGSGAGFPSLPVKIACPALAVVSVDAVGKKVDFQRHIARKLGFNDFIALHERVESLVDHESCRGGFDLVTARAVSSLGELVALAEPFVVPGGRLVAMKGPEGKGELDGLRDELSQEGWVLGLHRLKLPLSGSERCLVELTR